MDFLIEIHLEDGSLGSEIRYRISRSIAKSGIRISESNVATVTFFLLGRYNGKPSSSRAECLNWKPRQDRVSLFATCFFFRLFFLSFIFNFFFLNISFSELPVITASLFIHVMTLDGQYQNTKWRKIKAFIFHHNGKWLRTNTQKF